MSFANTLKAFTSELSNTKRGKGKGKGRGKGSEKGKGKDTDSSASQGKSLSERYRPNIYDL